MWHKLPLGLEVEGGKAHAAGWQTVVVEEAAEAHVHIAVVADASSAAAGAHIGLDPRAGGCAADRGTTCCRHGSGLGL